jgi:exosome complex exonuclease RRP6
MLLKTPSLFSSEQFAVFRAVHAWRDKIARTDDDSPNFVMNQQSLLGIAKLMPMDQVALLRIIHPATHGVKSRAGELLDIIKVAKSRGKTGPSMMDILRPDTIGAVAKRSLPTSIKTLVAATDEGDLRSENSSFWGDAFGSSIWDTPTNSNNQEIRLAVPLPALSSEIFATPNGFTDPPLVEDNHISLTLAPPRTSEKEDEAFILRRGSKRKSEAISDSASSEVEDNEIALPEESKEDEARTKAASRAVKMAEKKAAKAAKKAAKTQAAFNGAVDDEEEEMFDYTKAESVLHGKRKEGESGGKKKKKPFDPYQKSADAAKGMRRAQTERAGRSHTFKS